MKFTVACIALFCLLAYVNAGLTRSRGPPRSTGPTFPRGGFRFRREADPQGSVVLKGEKPLSGPDRRPSLDLNYNQRFHDRNGLTADAYGGLNVRPGQRAEPHLGLQFQREYNNGFIGGFGQAQRGPGGRIDPTFGIKGGFRFRRDAEDAQFDEEEH